MAEFLGRWLDHIQTQVQPRTVRFYAEKVANLIPALGAIRLARLRPEHVSDGRADGQGGLSPRSVHHCHRVLRQALAQACLWGAVNRNVASLVKGPKVNRIEMKTLNLDQTAKVIELARYEAIFVPILLGLLCGLRRGEICALRWRNIELDAGQLSDVASIEQGKGGLRDKSPKNGKGRRIALPPMFVTELRRHRLEQAQLLLKLGVRLTDDHHLVTTEDGEPVWPSSLGRAFKRFMRRHKLPDIRLHDLRHSHATHLLAAGVHPKIASERLGHSNISITLNTYSHVLPGMREDAVAKVDAALQAALNKRETR